MWHKFNLIRNSGLVGMNMRNAGYIYNVNPRENYLIVDNKILTKELAKKYGVPVPEMYYAIESHKEIKSICDAMKVYQEFVIKPASGACGNGIVLIKSHTEEIYIKTNGEVLPYSDICYHVSEILSGIFSLGGHEDIAILEYMVKIDPVFKEVSVDGIPDIRIIVYKGIPVMAMTRLPTHQSQGRANLHQGAIGAGIDITKGVTTYAVHKNQIITRHPDTGNPISGIQIPFWDKMLLIAALSYDITDLGYIGVDIVIDGERGPMVLELNARPGLNIQLANFRGLKFRFNKIDELNLIEKTSQERVDICKNVFKNFN